MVAENSRVCRSAGTLLRIVLDVLDEAHVEHLVGFVEHERADWSSFRVPRSDVVEDAAGGADDDLDAALEGPDLPVDGLAAVDRQDAFVRRICRFWLSSSATWMASSRVGARTSAWIWRLSVSIRSMIGMPKAAVLPVPVWAWPMTSRPASTRGMV